MDNSVLVNALLGYLCFVIVNTFHEAAHAWTALRRGDDTAALLGRISLNPLVHLHPVGSVLIPALQFLLSTAGSQIGLIGWGLPVPFNPARLKNRLWDGMLIALAGPAMNIVVAFAALLLAKISLMFQAEPAVKFFHQLAFISLYLCFFNLLPIPPLDGSHVMRYLFRIGGEAFSNMCRIGPFVLIVLVQLPILSKMLSIPTFATYDLMCWITQVPPRF